MSNFIALLLPFIGGVCVGGVLVWLAFGVRLRSDSGMADRFKALAADTLRANNESFLLLAESRLKQSEQASAAALDRKASAFDELVKPVKESLQKLDAQMQAIEMKREGAYSEVLKTLQMSNETQRQLRAETGQLLQALHSPNRRGSWCEIQLKRVFEMAGMAEHLRDFAAQPTFAGADGALRPDYVVALSGDRSVVFDCKVPLTAYLDYAKSEDQERRRFHLAQHAKAVREHIRVLSSREYWRVVEATPEFVVLFMPEHLLGAALDADPELFDYGIGRKIVLATPTTVLAILWSVAYGWKEEALRANVQKIGELGGELYGALATMTDHIAAVGSKLSGGLESYNRLIGSFERNVLSKARRLKEFGAAREGKPLPEALEPIDLQARALAAPDEDAA